MTNCREYQIVGPIGGVWYVEANDGDLLSWHPTEQGARDQIDKWRKVDSDNLRRLEV